jgi:hypothetical protein
MRLSKLRLFASAAAFAACFTSHAGAQAPDTLRGVVTDSATNAFLQDVDVSSEGASAKTGANGTFTLVLGATAIRSGAAFAPGIAWNDANAAFVWTASLGNVSIRVRDAWGRLAAEYVSGGKNSFSLAGLPPGIYLAAVRAQGAAYGYRIVHLRNGMGNFVSSAAVGAAPLAKAANSSKAHDLLFSKDGYASKTETVAAGTASNAYVTVKLQASGSGGKALETLQLSATSGTVTGKVTLDSTQIYLLKATGSIDFGADKVDAEYDFGSGAGRDSVGGADVGVDFGIRTYRIAKLVPALVGRMKWFGPYRADHAYYQLVIGEAKPVSLKLLHAGSGAGTGNITVSIMQMSPSNPLAGKEIDTVWAHVTKDSVHTHVPTALGAQYVLQCDGQGKVGGARLGMGDADYMDYDAAGAGQYDVGDQNTDYGLGVDEIYPGPKANTLTPRKRWWGKFRKDHIYYMMFTGTGHTVDFIFYDSGFGDNLATDHMTVRVFPAP